jgi:hypothetical protein
MALFASSVWQKFLFQEGHEAGRIRLGTTICKYGTLLGKGGKQLRVVGLHGIAKLTHAGTSPRKRHPADRCPSEQNHRWSILIIWNERKPVVAVEQTLVVFEGSKTLQYFFALEKRNAIATNVNWSRPIHGVSQCDHAARSVTPMSSGKSGDRCGMLENNCRLPADSTHPISRLGNPM